MGTEDIPKDVWANGSSYEAYVGRWSRLVAREFIRWLAIPENKRWLDVGCGTGALSQTILELTSPQSAKGIDRSDEYVEYVRNKIHYPQAEFEVGDAQALPVDSNAYDVAVSGLVLNFVPQPEQMIAEMKRTICKTGTVALYVWDYAEKMEFIRYFWDAASALDPDAQALDEGRRFPVCNPEALTGLFQHAGLTKIETRPIDVPTNFTDFDDYWSPFLGGQGPAPSYLMSLSEAQRSQLRERLYNSLPFAPDGSIPLVARAWAIQGVR